MQIEKNVRKLAQSSHWQSLYRSSKEIGGIYLFNNQTNFSGIQASFLYWLRVYSLLYTELSDMESPYLTEKVIKDDMRTDAYLYYRNRKQEQSIKKSKLEAQQAELGNKKKHSGKNVTPFSVDMQR